MFKTHFIKLNYATILKITNALKVINVLLLTAYFLKVNPKKKEKLKQVEDENNRYLKWFRKLIKYNDEVFDL